MKAVIVVVAMTCLALAALWRADYAFYNPREGVTAAGVANRPADAHAREVLEHTVSQADVTLFGRAPTLRRFMEFYGTTDASGCSVRRTFSTPDLAAATRPLDPGTRVRLCLN